MILELKMANWRAYDNQSFTFLPGINFIMGPNGKGKTSILEAISFALTGESSIVDNRNRLLRDPNKPATVSLIFEKDGKKYRIDRTQLPGKAGEAFLIDLKDNKQLASTQKRVTEAIEGLIGVSADFLRRIVYMAEGDVFRFLQKPTGEVMNQQVRRVLGLTQLDQFKGAIQLAKRELNDQSKTLKILQQRMNDLRITAGQDLDVQLSEVITQRENLMRQVLDLQAQIAKLSSEVQALSSLNLEINSRLSFWKANLEAWMRMQNVSLIDYFEELREDLDQRKEKTVELEKDLARLGGQKDSYRQVLEILKTVDKADTVPCPVCKKPLTPQEQHNVEIETRESLGKISSEINTVQKDLDQSKRQLQEVNRFLESVRDIRNDLVHNRYTDINPDMALNELIETVSHKSKNPQLTELTSRQDSIKKQVDLIEKQQADYISIQTQLKIRGFSQPSELQDAQIKIEERYLTLLAADEAVDLTLADMQNVDLVMIYKQIATIWNNFIRYGKWHLKFDQDGNPVLHQDESRDFNFDQFSGGEKTALLVIIHTIIAHHFSKCNFLMVDEPLEHLDSNNRRSLIGFFITACQYNFFEQALITTYEESLLRKYISDKNVNVLYLR
jgi:DNA repair protein SbcC/Rad50